ncbi:ABC transporter substrate-binding protein [Petrocella sp. FN5]|uniref:ABC transporter substrate-binding protein n=1 Tax=Petrocella sp. FN5 TaxID=3032002 RepID=UPI0023DB3E06|nr:extracellular solute-binding protein [Petrocella sp. FN5]MDF1617259.1 extracellular solute-binding protein [Petrocella sp. FN5]
MRKWLCCFLALLLLTGCKGGEVRENRDIGLKEDVEEKQILSIYQYKLEIVEPLRRLADAYEKMNPNVRIILQNSGGTDYYEMIKAEFAAGTQIDIFNIGTKDQLLTWQSTLEDLSDQSWVAHLKNKVADRITIDGKIYGMPYAIEGYGFIYNKTLFERAGILSLPNDYTEFVEMVKQLDDSGIRPFYNDYQEWWVISQHSFNFVIAGQNDPEAFIEGLRNGTVDLTNNQAMYKWLDLIDLTLKYGQEKPFMTGYSQSLEAFSKGEAAMIFQGNWTQDQLDQLNPELDMGILAVPLTENLKGKIPIGVPSYWCVNKQSNVKDIAKDFLDFMVNSQIGQSYMTDEFKFIPSFNHIPYDIVELGLLSESVNQYLDSGQYYDWYWLGLPTGAINEMNTYFYKYFNGEMELEKMLESIEDLIYSLSN